MRGRCVASRSQFGCCGTQQHDDRLRFYQYSPRLNLHLQARLADVVRAGAAGVDHPPPFARLALLDGKGKRLIFRIDHHVQVIILLRIAIQVKGEVPRRMGHIDSRAACRTSERLRARSDCGRGWGAPCERQSCAGRSETLPDALLSGPNSARLSHCLDCRGCCCPPCVCRNSSPK